MRRWILRCATLGLAFTLAQAQAERVEPPWNPPPADGRNFTVPGIDNVPDLYGDIVDPQLVVFFAGNQYMVVPDLIAAFRTAYPQYQRIFVETLPPGVLADQIEQGALIVGNMRIALKPDIYAAGRGRIDELQRDKQWFSRSADYARNRLAIMTAAGNPQNIAGWHDMAREDLRVCMPNPAWEGIAVNAIIPALRASGGEALVQRVYRDKAAAGTTVLTQIHHRQTPLLILGGECAAGAVWYTEAYYHANIKHHAIGIAEVADAQNRVVTYAAAIMSKAPHPAAAGDFLSFMASAAAQAVYASYGFLPLR